MMDDKTHVLIVAVQNYHHQDSYSVVAYAQKDANDFANALQKIGVPLDNITILSDNLATKTAIEAQLTILTRRLENGDQGIFYFAGHGAYLSKENFIVPVDGHKLMSSSTCISIDYIMGMFKESHGNKSLLFLDCCHSGFKPGNSQRGINDSFEPDDLIYKYRNEQYCIGFASCNSHEISVSNGELQNGVWTHFLIRALEGNAEGIYEDGILFSNNLQTYLSKNVPQFVKMNTEDRSNQNPIVFGSYTDRFILANLNPLFARKIELAESIKRDKDVDYTRLSLKAIDGGKIKALSGFLNTHRVPDRINEASDQFIKRIGDNDINSQLSSLVNLIQENFNYKRKEVNVYGEVGSAQIVTPDFTLYLSIRQDENNPTLYLIEKEIAEMDDPNIIQSNEFDLSFGTSFNRLSFSFSKKINIENLIDIIEELPETNDIKVKYNAANPISCILSIKKLDFEIHVEATELSIVSTFSTRPKKLIEAFKMASTTINQSKIFLLK